MDTSFKKRLSRLQRDVVKVLAEEGQDYFLTGGIVLAGWILYHRNTDDLDIFTEHDRAIEAAERMARYIANSVQSDLQVIQKSPDFQRFLLSRGDESVQIDFVRDRAPQIYPKVIRDGVRMDSVEEIVVNKLCALVGRNEIRDLVDLMYLERAGYDLLSFLKPAAKKDGGVTPATLAWILSTFSVPNNLPGEASREEVVAFKRDLEKRMRHKSRPN